MAVCMSSRAGRATVLVFALCVVILFAFSGLAPARATAPATDQVAPIVDQSFTGPVNLGADINECCMFVAQTFTAGLAGVLTGVSVDITGFHSSRLHVEIRTVESGAPTATVLGETVLDSNSASLSQVIDFPTPIVSTAGVQYAIVVSYEGAPPPGGGQGQGIWHGATGDPYAGGQLLLSVDGSSWFAAPDADVHFVTYVLPLPSSQEQCTDDGWRAFGIFKNQGDCVSFVVAHGPHS